MKKHYEIAFMQHVTGSVEDDYETTWFLSYESYRMAHQKAKEFSKFYGEVSVPGSGFRFLKREKPCKDAVVKMQPLDKGLAMVKIVCYTETSETSYQPIYYQYYKDGKIFNKIEF